MAPKNEGPDQARSWAIALAACVINTLISGLGRVNGLFYVALIESYGVSRLQANLPFTVRNVVRNLAGPLVVIIGQRYGPRDVTIVGGVLSSLGIIFCFFAPNVLWITILWGGMHGIGVALGNTLFSVIVTQYFLKYRATASGLALSGVCLASLVFPVLFEYIITNFGLAGTFLLTGGLIMHVLPASIMLVEPPWIRKKTTQVHPQMTIPSIKIPKTSHVMSMIKEEGNGTVADVKDISMRKITKISSSGNLDKDGKGGQNRISNGIENAAFVGSRMGLNEKESYETEEESIFQERLRTISFGEVSITIPISSELQETSISKGMLKMLRDPMFHMISLSMAAFAMVFDVSVTVIVDYLMDKGMKADVAKYFISMMSLGDLIGRLGFGWVTDKDCMSVPKFMLILQVGLGICSLLMPLFNNFDALLAVVVTYGIIAGATLVMFPILVGKYLKSVQSLAIGFSSFFTGMLGFAVPPIIGYYRDRVGSYDGMFYITGGMSVVIGFIWLFEPLLLRFGTRTEKEQSASFVISPK